jgi:hypothetical protein
VSEDPDATQAGPAVAGTITTQHRYAIPMAREHVWARIGDVGDYRAWWPWLRGFEATALAPGAEWRCEVQPPLPYLVRFTVAIEHVEAPSVVRARVLGDVVGTATVTLEDAPAEGDDAGGPGCIARLDSSLAPGNAALRLVSRFAAPVARFGHDWVLDSGARLFITRGLAPAVTD